jgi:4-carboxymuconolactone decarboxylase
MKQEFPFLDRGDAGLCARRRLVPNRASTDRTRQLAAVAAFAATGETGFMKIHAGYALNIGVQRG